MIDLSLKHALVEADARRVYENKATGASITLRSADTRIHLRCPACSARRERDGFHVRGQFCACGWSRTRFDLAAD